MVAAGARFVGAGVSGRQQRLELEHGLLAMWLSCGTLTTIVGSLSGSDFWYFRVGMIKDASALEQSLPEYSYMTLMAVLPPK